VNRYRIFRLLGVFLALISCSIQAVERKSPDEVSLDALVQDSQVMVSGPNSMDLIWYIPFEMWEASFSQDKFMSDVQRSEMLMALQPFFMVATVQSDIGVFGNFEFFEKKHQLKVIDETGDVAILKPLDPLPSSVESMVQFLVPFMAASFGEFGGSMRFQVYEARNSDGEVLLSPYDTGVVQVDLFDSEGAPRSSVSIELPIDALHVPRICPNGRPAHVSWNYCPWDGSELLD